MKVSLYQVSCVLFLLPQLLFAFNNNNDQEIDDAELEYCSSAYLRMEHQLEKAFEHFVAGDIDHSTRIYDGFDSLLETADLPVKEKVILANSVSKGYLNILEWQKGGEFAKKYLDLAKRSLSEDDYQLAKAYENLGAFQTRTNDLQNSFENLSKAFDILKTYSQQSAIHTHLGKYYLSVNQWQSAVNSYSLALDNLNDDDKSNQNIRSQFWVYFGYGWALLNYGDFAKAEHCVEMMDKISKQLQDPLINFLVAYKNAQFFLNLGQKETALTYLNKELPSHPLIDKYKAGYYFYHAIAHAGLSEHSKAIEYYKLRIEHQLSFGAELSELGKSYKWLGTAYDYNDQPEKALEAFDNALCIFENNEGNFKTSIAGVYNSMGDLHLYRKQLDKAKANFILSLQLHDERTVDKIEDVSALTSVHLEYFNRTRAERHVDSILHYMDINDKLLKQMRKEHRYFSEQGAVESAANELYSMNLDVLEQIYNSSSEYGYLIDRLFSYIEGVKAYSFKKELKEQEGLHTYGVPNELIDKINVEKKEVKILQDEIYELEYKNTNAKTELTSQAVIDVKKQLLSASIDTYNATLLNVETDYPSYFNYKYSNSSVSIKDIQSILDPQEAVVEYFTSETSIFIISIESDTVHYINKKKPQDWVDLIVEYSNSVTNSEYQHQDSISVTYSKFTNSSHKLYNIILKDVIEQMDDKVKYLTIVPDEQLHYIQFDNLLTEKPIGVQDYKDLDYLINDYTISRAASAFMYSSVKKKSRRHNKYKYIGFAPKYGNENIAIVDSLDSDRKERAEYFNALVTRGAYNDLPSARKSVNLIASILDGISFTGEKATRETFLERSHEGNIVHFAGHAIVEKEPKFSQLLFSHVGVDSQLYASDIYDMGLDIDLAVLSACNTGNGKSRYGEGVMSLSRAFKYAGCSSLVMSLWNIPDVQTSKVDYSFFSNIEEGQRIDEALRNSKLKFLEEATYQTAHPFYWSGLTASGNMKPIKTSNLWDRFVQLF